VSLGYLPELFRNFADIGSAEMPWLFGQGGIEIGPIPAGSPVGLLSNLNQLSEEPSKRLERDARFAKAVLDLTADLKRLGKYVSDEQADAVLVKRVDELLALSKCPDLVVNRGHYFGTDYLEPAEKADPNLRAKAISDRGAGLSDSDKRALIEFLKTF